MPRKYVERRERLVLSIPESLGAQLDLLTYDPVRGRPRYGGRSEIAIRALREYLDRNQPKEPDDDRTDAAE